MVNEVTRYILYYIVLKILLLLLSIPPKLLYGWVFQSYSIHMYLDFCIGLYTCIGAVHGLTSVVPSMPTLFVNLSITLVMCENDIGKYIAYSLLQAYGYIIGYYLCKFVKKYTLNDILELYDLVEFLVQTYINAREDRLRDIADDGDIDIAAIMLQNDGIEMAPRGRNIHIRHDFHTIQNGA